MSRIAVAAVLMVLQLASPLLCCCSAARVAASVTRAVEAPSEPSDLPPCCRHKARRGQDQAASDQPQKQQAPGRPACPCRQHSARNVALAPEAEAGSQLQLRQLPEALAGLLSFAPVGLAPVSLGDSFPQSDADAHPFLTAALILRAYHILRC